MHAQLQACVDRISLSTGTRVRSHGNGIAQNLIYTDQRVDARKLRATNSVLLYVFDALQDENIAG